MEQVMTPRPQRNIVALRRRIEAEQRKMVMNLTGRRSAPKINIGCAYEGDFGKQIIAARRLPPGPPLVAPREPGIIEQLAELVLQILAKWEGGGR